VHDRDVIDKTRPSRTAVARALALGAALAIAVAACGSTTPTSPLLTGSTPSQTAAATPDVTPAPTASPPAIYPVPTSQPEAPAAAPAAQLDSKTAANLQTALNTLRTRGQYPGISAAVVFPDGSLWAGAAGSAILSSKTPVATGTLFSIGSISKTFVAALALRLAGRGTIGLDDPLSKYLPAYPNAAHITLRQLLDHRSGIHDVFTSSGMANAIISDPSRIWTTAEVLARIGKPYFTPGSGYVYSNTNYILLGEAIEKATNQTIAALVRTEFLQPLGLANTWFQPEETVSSSSFAHGYMGKPAAPIDRSAGQKMLPYNSEATVAGASGGFVSTASDLARWASDLYGGGVLGEADLASMVDVSPTLPYRPPYPYGYGFERATISGQMAWGHRGHLDGFWSAMWYLPSSRITIVILTNDEWTNTQTASAQLVRTLLGG
jgi:D-alanyl-D-alanine carboxypeptidase